jgi:hypothetical protein
VRITGQLIDSINGAHLWADHFDGPTSSARPLTSEKFQSRSFDLLAGTSARGSFGSPSDSVLQSVPRMMIGTHADVRQIPLPNCGGYQCAAAQQVA